MLFLFALFSTIQYAISEEALVCNSATNITIPQNLTDSISVPSYWNSTLSPPTYSSNQDCRWYFQIPHGYYAHLVISSFISSLKLNELSTNQDVTETIEGNDYYNYTTRVINHGLVGKATLRIITYDSWNNTIDNHTYDFYNLPTRNSDVHPDDIMVHINLTRLAHTCELLMSEQQIDIIEQRHERLHKSTSTILIITPIFSLLSFLFSLSLLAAIIFALLGRKIPSRKYSIIISRTSADIFSSVLIAAASLFANTFSASYMVLTLFLYICTFGVIHLTTSHCAVIVLRHISVTRPYGFQSICSIRRLSMTVIFSWILSIMYLAAYAPMINVIVNPSKESTVCGYHSCQRPLIITAISIVFISMFTVLSSFGIVCLKMTQVSHTEKMHNEPQATKKKLYKFLKFGAHLALYTLIVTLLVIGAFVILKNAEDYHQVNRMISINCDVYDYINIKLHLETVAGGAVLLWCVRIIFDVLITFLGEIRLLPWIKLDNLESLDNKKKPVLHVRHGLGWQKGSLNCPVFNIDNRLHPLDFKN
ncbi:unnamed protein product [Caenorhabditis angaria]|uniref:G-protein coupled receptors family 1 profile domain-containing protein n=1 Tax=Caenorhabditis angaria TaxID=860376 RepID=A0A9P1N236_9PELO|nr:unnamed protein product [Caenorhabditis angaria]